MTIIALGDEVPSGTGPTLAATLARINPDIVWEALAPRLEERDLPIPRTVRWDLAIEVASAASSGARIAELEAYRANKPFLAATAAVLQNQRTTRERLPELDRWIAARQARWPSWPLQGAPSNILVQQRNAKLWRLHRPDCARFALMRHPITIGQGQQTRRLISAYAAA